MSCDHFRHCCRTSGEILKGDGRKEGRKREKKRKMKEKEVEESGGRISGNVFH